MFLASFLYFFTSFYFFFSSLLHPRGFLIPLRNEHSEEEKCISRWEGVEKKENLRWVRSFNFGKLNNYQLFNVLFPLHNSALDPRFSKKVIKIMGNRGASFLSLAQLNYQATYTQKRIMDLLDHKHFGFCFPFNTLYSGHTSFLCYKRQ